MLLNRRGLTDCRQVEFRLTTISGMADHWGALYRLLRHPSDSHLALHAAMALTSASDPRGRKEWHRREIEVLVQPVNPRAPMPFGAALQPTDLLGLAHVAASQRPATTSSDRARARVAAAGPAAAR